jgi:hypothetical protein
MKKLFFAALIVVSFLSLTINPGMSWDEINKTDRYSTIQVHGVFISVDKFCVDGDVVVADSNYKQCVEWGDAIGDNDPECIRYESVVMERPIVYSEKICTEWTDSGDNVVCTNYEDVEQTLPITSQAEVYFDRGIGENPEIFLFNKAHTIPACNE